MPVVRKLPRIFFSSTSSQRSLWSTAAVPMQPKMALMSLSP